MEEVQKLGKTYDTLGNQKDQFHTFILCLVCQHWPMDTVTDGIDAEKFTHEPSVCACV